MQDLQFSSKVAYASLFSKTVEEAAQNMIRLIAGRLCGLDEGPAVWREALGRLLESPEELGQLNRFGANFTDAEWRLILERVRGGLEGLDE